MTGSQAPDGDTATGERGNCEHEWMMVTEYHGDINQDAIYLECRKCGIEDLGNFETVIYGSKYKSVGYPELNHERHWATPAKWGKPIIVGK
jgi:hypothetical protein